MALFHRPNNTKIRYSGKSEIQQCVGKSLIDARPYGSSVTDLDHPLVDLIKLFDFVPRVTKSLDSPNVAEGFLT